MTSRIHCPKCDGTNILRERRPLGDTRCASCHFVCSSLEWDLLFAKDTKTQSPKGSRRKTNKFILEIALQDPSKCYGCPAYTCDEDICAVTGQEIDENANRDEWCPLKSSEVEE